MRAPHFAAEDGELSVSFIMRFSIFSLDERLVFLRNPTHVDLELPLFQEFKVFTAHILNALVYSGNSTDIGASSLNRHFKCGEDQICVDLF